MGKEESSGGISPSSFKTSVQQVIQAVGYGQPPGEEVPGETSRGRVSGSGHEASRLVKTLDLSRTVLAPHPAKLGRGRSWSSFLGHSQKCYLLNEPTTNEGIMGRRMNDGWVDRWMGGWMVDGRMGKEDMNCLIN